MKRAAIINVLWVVSITAVLLSVPLYQRNRTSDDRAGGGTIRSADHLTLIEVNGGGRTAAVLLLPLAISVIPLISARRALIAGLAMGAFAVWAGASVGLWYLPGAVVLIAAGIADRISRPRES